MVKYIDKLVTLLNKIKKILIKIKIKQRLKKNKNKNPQKQDLEVYWSENFRSELNNWGKNDVWPEIKCFTQFLKGDIVDMCCGTGSTINYLYPNKSLNLFGFDISDLSGSEKVDALGFIICLLKTFKTSSGKNSGLRKLSNMDLKVNFQLTP